MERRQLDATVAGTGLVLSETLSRSADSVEHTLSVFRHVRALPTSTFQDIMRRHYGSEAFICATSGPAVQTETCNNLSVYLRISYMLGKREGAVADISEAHTAMTVRGNESGPHLESEKLPVPQDRASQTPSPETEAVETSIEHEDELRHLDAVACNTTRSWYLEIGSAPSEDHWTGEWADGDDVREVDDTDSRPANAIEGHGRGCLSQSLIVEDVDGEAVCAGVEGRVNITFDEGNARGPDRRTDERPVHALTGYSTILPEEAILKREPNNILEHEPTSTAVALLEL